MGSGTFLAQSSRERYVLKSVVRTNQVDQQNSTRWAPKSNSLSGSASKWLAGLRASDRLVQWIDSADDDLSLQGCSSGDGFVGEEDLEAAKICLPMVLREALRELVRAVEGCQDLGL